jgi:alpha-galactosidase
VLSNADEGTADGDTEVWGGPLSGGDFVMAAVNRGGAAANITLNWTMLGVSGVSAASKFDVRDLWAKKVLERAQAGGFQANVPSHDIAIYRLAAAPADAEDFV